MKRRFFLHAAVSLAVMHSVALRPLPSRSREGEASNDLNFLARDLISQHGSDPVFGSYFLFLLSAADMLALDCHDYFNHSNLNSFIRAARLHIMKTFYAWDDRVIFLANQQDELIEPEIIRINKAVSSLLQQFRLVSNASSYLRSPGEALDLWISLENRPALQPNWDKMKYFGISDIKPVEICGIPPKVGSEAFQNQIALVRKRANKASISDIQIAQKWADGIGTFSPCGRWNQLIESHIFSSDMSLNHKLRAVSTAQAAMYNAGIACWTVKYTFWVPRPSQVDSSINAHIKIPNFPAYPSGHSCFSWAAVKSLEKDFPSISTQLRRFAAEASESRIIAGVHYPMDCAAGKHLGSFIGEKTARSVDSIKRFMKFATDV